MPALARGQTSDCSNPALDIWTTVSGVLTDVAELEYQIFDKTSGTPVQVHPVSGRATVDVAQLCPLGGKISTGRYVATYTPPLTEALGTHEIRWFFKLTLVSPEQTFSEEFEVLAEVVGLGNDGYTSVQAMRDEGVSATVVDDATLQEKIARATKFIDKVTGRHFAPQSKVMLVDGRASHSLMLDEPIIDITGIRILSALYSTSSVVDLENIRIYNRHLTQGIVSPDDRDNPRLEFAFSAHPYDYEHQPPGYDPFQIHIWPKGWQNIEVTGVFGYTDPDGSAYGSTPILIQRAAQLLVFRDIYRLADVSAREDVRNRWRLLSERTRDQSYTLASLHGRQAGVAYGSITGDPEVDSLLVMYKRPSQMRAV